MSRHARLTACLIYILHARAQYRERRQWWIVPANFWNTQPLPFTHK